MGIGSVALAWLLKQERLLAMPANVRKSAADIRPEAQGAALRRRPRR